MQGISWLVQGFLRQDIKTSQSETSEHVWDDRGGRMHLTYTHMLLVMIVLFHYFTSSRSSAHPALYAIAVYPGACWISHSQWGDQAIQLSPYSSDLRSSRESL